MSYDITIIGAGPAGLSFAQLLADTGMRVALIEKQPAEQLASPEFDGRDIALTHRSIRILGKLGIWDRIAPDDKPRIDEARVLNGTSPYSLVFGREGSCWVRIPNSWHNFERFPSFVKCCALVTMIQ